jgi:A/G-specific adenine glycosylase
MLPAMRAKANPRAAAWRRRLSAWYRRAARDLPWRRTRDPWAIVVSEFMLQQTQVSRVLGYYRPFLERYPSPHALARARPAAVREAWDGLGYYRRAANLQALARVVVKEHAGRLPDEVEALERLPGIGKYTAGAVACFAYEKPAATVDTNVGRVLARAFHRPAKQMRQRQLIELARSLQPRAGKAAWTFNQALMELGALICTARNPGCEICPIRKDCGWRSAKPAEG